MMDWLDTQVPIWAAALDAPSLWWQLATLLACLILAWPIARGVGAKAQAGDATDAPSPSQQRPLSAGYMLAFPVALGVLLLLAWLAFLALGMAHAALRVALVLAVTFTMVRLLANVLLMALQPGPLLRSAANLVVVVFWAWIALYVLGWLPVVLEALDAAGFMFGSSRVSVLLVMRVLVVALLVLSLALWLSHVLETRVMRSENLSASARVGISKVVKLLILVVAVIFTLQILGVNLSALAVIGGTLGLGIGLGLQGIVSNFISGFILLSDRSIKPGDVVTVEDKSGSRYGWIQEMRARYVVVRDRDGVDTLVPNENFITNPVINWSYGGKSIRLKLPVQISYEDDPELAMKLMVQAAVGRRRVLEDPAPAARLMGFGENGIDLQVRVWATEPEKGVNNVRSEINLAIWNAFKEHGISMPFPQRDVRIVESGAPASRGRSA